MRQEIQPAPNFRSDYERTQWRKRLERQGWISCRRAAPPNGVRVYYQAIFAGQHYSGEIDILKEPQSDWWVPGSPMYLLVRGFRVDEAVWKRAR